MGSGTPGSASSSRSFRPYRARFAETQPELDREILREAMPVAESEFLRAFREGFEQGNQAWNAGDVKTAYAALPDQLEYRLAPTWPEARVLRSRDEVIEFFESFQETFPDARTGSHEYLQGAHGTVVAGFRVAGTGRASGAESEMEIWQVWEIRDQDNLTVTRVTEFTNRRAAIKAAGLSG
jgi:ketosteroid isomerase-like protein